MTTVSISDIHGYLDCAIELISAIEDEIGQKLVERNDDGWNYVGNVNFVLNGDLFDRGNQNKEALNFAFQILESDKVVYNMGNHEFFAMFPHVSREFLSEKYFEKPEDSDLFWENMPEKLRGELIDRTAKGDITAGFSDEDIFYVHGGLKHEDISEMNKALKKAGSRVKDGYGKYRDTGDIKKFLEAQRDIVRSEETENGVELYSDSSLFDVYRGSDGRVSEGGVFWRSFVDIMDEDPKQVVGHKKMSDVRDQLPEPPAINYNAVNVNSIRDFVNNENDYMAATIQEGSSVKLLKFDGEEVEVENITF